MTFVAMQIPSRCEVITSICHSHGAYVVSPCLLRSLHRTQMNSSLLQCLQTVGHGESFRGTNLSRSAKIVSIKNAMQHSLGELSLKLWLTIPDQPSALPVKEKKRKNAANKQFSHLRDVFNCPLLTGQTHSTPSFRLSLQDA